MEPRSEGDAVGALCRALDCGELGPLAARLDHASVLRVPGHSGLGGHYQGREAIVGLLQRMATATDGTLRFEVHDTLASLRGALLIEGWLSGTRDGRPARMAVSMEALITGQVFRSITIECADRPAWDALWGGNVGEGASE